MPKAGGHAVLSLLDRMGLRRVPGTILPAGDGLLYVEGMPVMSLAAARAIPDSCYMLAHAPARCAAALSGFCVMTVIRDPRAVLCSYVRHRRREDGLDVTIPEALAQFWDWGEFVPTYRSFLGWIGRAIVLRYEDLPPSQVGAGAGIYPSHQRHLNTRTGKPSRWWDYWSDEAEAAWRTHGGEKLLIEAGYQVGAPTMPENTGNPNDPSLKEQGRALSEQIEALENQIAEAQGKGESTAALEQQLKQLAEQKQALKRDQADARSANLDQRQEERAAAKAERRQTKEDARAAKREGKGGDQG